MQVVNALQDPVSMKDMILLHLFIMVNIYFSLAVDLMLCKGSICDPFKGNLMSLNLILTKISQED